MIVSFTVLFLAHQAMACGLPIIITNYSAHTQYCTPENSYLIDCDKLEPASDGGKWFGSGTGNEGSWMAFNQPQIDQCVEHMRAAYQKGPASNEHGLKTAQSLTWEICATKIKNLIFGQPNETPL